MAVPFDWGEYVLWHLGPGVKVSIDGRRETAYAAESYQQSLDFARGTGLWDALLKTTTTDLVLAPNGSPTANLMSRRDGWVPLYQDTCCVLFIREGFPDFGQIMETPVPSLPDDGNGLCFPAPRRRQRVHRERNPPIFRLAEIEMTFRGREASRSFRSPRTPYSHESPVGAGVRLANGGSGRKDLSRSPESVFRRSHSWRRRPARRKRRRDEARQAGFG